MNTVVAGAWIASPLLGIAGARMTVEQPEWSAWWITGGTMAAAAIALVLLGAFNLAWLVVFVPVASKWTGRVSPVDRMTPEAYATVVLGPLLAFVATSMLAGGLAVYSNDGDPRSWIVIVAAPIVMVLGTAAATHHVTRSDVGLGTTESLSLNRAEFERRCKSRVNEIKQTAGTGRNRRQAIECIAKDGKAKTGLITEDGTWSRQLRAVYWTAVAWLSTATVLILTASISAADSAQNVWLAWCLVVMWFGLAPIAAWSNWISTRVSEEEKAYRIYSLRSEWEANAKNQGDQARARSGRIRRVVFSWKKRTVEVEVDPLSGTS